MYDRIERAQLAIAIIFTIHFAAMVFVDRAQLMSRRASLQGNACRVPIVWAGIGSSISFRVFWLVWLVLLIARDIFFDPGRHAHAPLPLWEWIVLWSLAAVFLLEMVADIRFLRRMRILKSFQISRGFLFSSVKGLSRRIGYLGIGTAPLIVTPDAEFPMACDRVGSGVLLPMGLLDQLSRKEIDALATRQLSVQSRGLYFPLFYVLLACDSVVVALLFWFNAAPVYSFLFCVSLLAAELLALNLRLPHMLFQAELRAIRVTGDVESYLSALGGLLRFTGSPIDESFVQQIARLTKFPVERAQMLLGPHETSMEERYPTSGSYMDTGL